MKEIKINSLHATSYLLRHEGHGVFTSILYFQVYDMIDFLDNEVDYESILVFAIKDAGEGLYFRDSDIAFMESLGAGGSGCPIGSLGKICIHLCTFDTIW